MYCKDSYNIREIVTTVRVIIYSDHISNAFEKFKAIKICTFFEVSLFKIKKLFVNKSSLNSV